MENEPEATSSGDERRFHVLLVDDNQDLLDAVRFALFDDYVIETANSAEDALERIEQLTQRRLPDCMVIDVKMPGLNGVQLVRILRGDPATAQIPLIILSAYVQGEDVLRGQLAGVDHYLAKPFNLETLIEAIQRATRMTPEERAQWFEHNTYWALCSTDQYVWLYSERMNWWKDQTPPGLEAAVLRARQKIRDDKPLGFDIDSLIAAAKARPQSAQ